MEHTTRKVFRAIMLLFVFSPATCLFSQSEWEITAENFDTNNYYGITVANGMVGLVSAPEPMKVSEIVLNGTFDTYGRGRVSNILKVFNFADLDLDVDGTRINRKNIRNFRQTLDMKKAVFTTTFDFEDKISVSYSVRALRHLPYTSLIDVSITAKNPVEVVPASVIEAPDILRDVKNFYTVIDRPHAKIPLMTSVANSPTGKYVVAASNSFIFPESKTHYPELIHEDWDYNRHLTKFKKQLKKGEVLNFSIVGSVCSSEDFDDPHNEAERLSIYAMLEGRDRLLMRHHAAWDALWESDIIIEGDPASQKDIRSAIYHLYSFAREGTALSISPMGLSGLGYNGHAFWDTEIWMYPPLLLLQPEIARSLLDYRIDRLEAAKKNAFSHGYKGAMYPWESAGSGQEETPVWALTGPFQHHISGCVAWAMWKYYQVTGDKEWLVNRAYPVIEAVADFWVSRVEKSPDGSYHIINVVAADEWAENIDDDAFTNGIAKEVLGYAIQAAEIAGTSPNPEWKKVGDGLVIHRFKDGTVREHATYEGEMIKQADVNLLAYPLKVVTDEPTIIKNLKYYEAKVDPNGPAMTHAVFSTLYSRLGDPTNAFRLFKQGYKPNENPPFGVLAETAGGTNPYFATGAGGMLQSVLAGFGGLYITDEGIVQIPVRLPKGWKSLKMTGIGLEKKTYEVR